MLSDDEYWTWERVESAREVDIDTVHLSTLLHAVNSAQLPRGELHHVVREDHGQSGEDLGVL